ncbi:hypothetical protein YC2023_042184 [Brassica napus]
MSNLASLSFRFRPLSSQPRWLLSLDLRLKLTLLHTRVTPGSSNIGDGLAIAEPQMSPEIMSPEIQVRASPDHGVTIGSSNISCFALKASRPC